MTSVNMAERGALKTASLSITLVRLGPPSREIRGVGLKLKLELAERGVKMLKLGQMQAW